MKYLFLYLTFSFFALTMKAQRYEDKLLIMGSPQHLIRNGLSIDVDWRIKNNSWIVFSPQYYFVENNRYSYDYSGFSSMSGVGLGVAKRSFITQRPFYFSYGVAYHYFDFGGIYPGFPHYYPYENYIPGSVDTRNLTINRLTGTCTIGFQGELAKHLFLDLYVGFGMRYSIYDGDKENFLSESMYDLGYTGIMLVGGFRLGVGI